MTLLKAFLDRLLQHRDQAPNYISYKKAFKVLMPRITAIVNPTSTTATPETSRFFQTPDVKETGSTGTAITYAAIAASRHQ